MENGNALKQREQRLKTEHPSERSGDRAKEGTAGAMEQAKETATQFVTDVGKKADDAAHVVAGGMKSLAKTLRDTESLGAASCAVADTLESGGRYLQESGLSGIGTDVGKMVRKNPIPAFFIGIGLGFLIARATKI